jgi:hypothetical protein
MSLGILIFSGFSLCLTLYCWLLNVRLDFYNVVLVELNGFSWIRNSALVLHFGCFRVGI